MYTSRGERPAVSRVEKIPANALVAADQVVSRHEIEGEAHRLLASHVRPSAATYYAERHDNARTALMEALTASGHLSRIEITGSLEDINRQVLTRLLNGWDESLPAHETKRRFAELCEELTIQRIHHRIAAGELPSDTVVHVNSDYPEALDGAMRFGYRPWNKKGMVRSTYLTRGHDGTYCRVIEQISRSNSTDLSTQRLLEAAGVCQPAGEARDLAALRGIIVYRRSYLWDGVVDIQRRLDAYGGQGIAYGERAGANPLHVPYESLRHVSQEREARIEAYTKKLADYSERLDAALARGAINQADRDALFGKEVQQILRAICVLAPEFAADTFGAAAAGYYYKASDMVARGDTRRARLILLEGHSTEQTITFCGAAVSSKEASALGIKIDSLGDLIEEGKEAMPFTMGYCRVPACPTSPKMTEVGPCSVCRGCQRLYDRHSDPEKIYARRFSRKSLAAALGALWKAPTLQEHENN